MSCVFLKEFRQFSCALVGDVYFQYCLPFILQMFFFIFFFKQAITMRYPSVMLHCTLICFWVDTSVMFLEKKSPVFLCWL